MSTRMRSLWPARGAIRNRSRRMCRRRGSPASLPRRSIGYRVVPELRGVVVFTVQDVLADPPFSRLDLISCRNLLIYLRPEAQEKVLLLFHFALGEGGVLMLGGSETVGSLDDRFEPISKAQRIYRQIGRSRPGEVDFPVGAGGRARAIWPGAPHPPTARGVTPGDLTHRLLIETYAPASVLINRKHECLYYSGPTDRYLRVAGGRAQPRSARHGARGLAPKARCGDPAGEPGARAGDRHQRAGELRRQRRRGPHRGPSGAQRTAKSCCWSASSTNPSASSDRTGRPSPPMTPRGSPSSNGSSTPPARNCRTPSTTSRSPTKSKRRSTRKRCRRTRSSSRPTKS